MADGYISQIKTPDNKVYDFRDQHLKVYTGSCTTAAGTAIKDVTTDGEFTLAKGAVVFVNFSATNTAAVGNLKLRVNSSNESDAKAIKWLNNASDPANIPGVGYLRANQTYIFRYDGTNWVVDLQYDSNSNDFASRIGHYNNILARKAITAESLIVGDATGYEKVASGVTFDLAYPIVWCTAAVEANKSNYANMFLQHYDRNIATGAKTGFTSSANNVIYLIVTINGNIATIDSNIITDTLPSSVDGKVYISLGKLGAQSTGANYFFLYPIHPMFEYKNGEIRTYEAQQHLSEIDGTDDLQAIEALTGTSGLLKKTAANTWTLDTNAYSLTSHNHNSAYLKLDGSNNMTADVNIIAGDTDKFVNFWYNTNKTAGASWRMGMLGSGSGNTNYFVIQSGTSTTSATTWHNALKIGQNNYEIYNNENRIPNTGNATGSVGDTTTPIYVDAGVIKTGTALKDLAYISKGSGTTKFLREDGTWQTALTSHQSLAAYAKLASPEFTGTPTAPTAANGTSTTQIATTEFVNNTLSYVNAMRFKGTLGTGGTVTALPASHEAGDTYRVITAGTWAGEDCAVGTLIICTTDGTAANDAHWACVGTNEDGTMIGPESSTDNAIVRFDGTTGRIIQNSKVTIDDDGCITLTHIAGKSKELSIQYGSTIDYWWGVGTANTNHGMFDVKASKWIISAGADNNWYFSGNADSATSANYINLYEARNTTTTLNKTANYITAGAMFHLVASSSTSATDNGKTPTDANILQMNWDNNGGYDAQLGIATAVNRMYFRSRSSQKTAWDEVAHAPVGTTGVGSDTQPVYMTSDGVITACTAYGSASVNYAASSGNVTGTVAIEHGGTGATSAEDARTNLNTVTGNARVFYGTCNTAAATTLKEVICAQYDKILTIGDMLIVKFDNTNSGAVGSLQITVKNSTSDSAGTTAKNIKRQYNSTGANNLVATGELNKDSIAVFVYNGTYWILTNADYNNTYSYDWTTGASGNGRTAETAANGGVGIHRYSLQMMTLNLTWSSLSSDHPTAATTNGAATDKTVATCGFLLDSPIIYQDTNANAIPGNSANVNGYTTGSINLQYSTTNAQWSALTIQKPVYLIGALQSDGTFKLNATKWWTQTLPTSDDGQIYIFLGMAYSATNIYLHDAHPIYWYKDGKIQPYSGYATATSRAAITTTANAVAYYTNTTGTFGSKASANGALYATSANGALQWGTLPIAQGGTGVTSFTKNHVILSDNTNGTTGLTSRAYSDSTSAGALSNSSTNFVTERDVYFGLPTLNNAHNYTSSSTYYAPTAGGTAGHILIGAGATTAPAWYGGTVMNGTAAASWKTAFNGTTDATATNAAAVTIAGGLGIGKKLYVGDTATVPDLTIGSTNEYGDAYTPIYWHEGVPTAVTLTQQCAFTIKSGMSGVKLAHAAITANSYVTQIVVTSGEANLNSAISWTSAAGYIELTCSSTVSGDVTGYIMISRGGEITATATDIA